MHTADRSDLNRWRVIKFGGSSVANPACWPHIAKTVQTALDEGARLLVVVSALRGITDLLAAQTSAETAQPAGRVLEEVRRRHIDLAAQLGLTDSGLDDSLAALRHCLDKADLGENPAAQAELMAQGELLSSRLAVVLLDHFGLQSNWLDAREVLRCPEDPNRSPASEYLSAHCPAAPNRQLQARLAETDRCHVMPGFLAANSRAETVLLGRGGSDTSASCAAAVLEAERVEIHSDVPGLFSADPRRIPGARLLKMVSYREAQELAAMGAKALHPRSLIPVTQYRIPLWLRQVDRPDMEGTRISPQARDHGAQVKAIVQRKGMTLVALEGIGMWQQVGFLADIFTEFKTLGLSVDQVSTSESNVTVTLDPGANVTDQATLRELRRRLERHCRVEILTDCATISLVGLGIRTILHRLGPALEVFEQRRIFQVSQAANDLNLTFVV
ncbi:MAG: aspartate kinase, partial [Wenzhouxiangella sp.]